jgi:hypothetical protein
MADSSDDARALASATTTTWLWWIAVSGTAATATFALIAGLSEGAAWLLMLLAFVFAISLSVGSVAIWLVLASDGKSGPLAMFAAMSNVVAGAIFLSMVAVQLAVKDVADPPDEGLRAVYWGLDVAWDLYIALGTVGLAISLYHARWLRLWAFAGLAAGAALFVLNLASFPEPPGTAGLVDIGPLVGLWYTGVTIGAIVRLYSAAAMLRAARGSDS